MSFARAASRSAWSCFSSFADASQPVLLLAERANEPLAQLLLARAVAERAEVLANALLLRVDLVPLLVQVREPLLDRADLLPLREHVAQRLLGRLVEVLRRDPRRELLVGDVGSANDWGSVCCC